MVPVNRLAMVQRHLSNGSQVCIGSVCVPLKSSINPQNIPTQIFPGVYENQEILNHLQWMMKKDSLGQDIFLYGPPGPFKRRVALSYLALTQQEIEYLHIHPDTSSESDMKQRREIGVDSNGAQVLKWVDGVCVRAAIHGRCLVIEGIEKADRNVLPVLNNLLENREMSLEDGRHIISSSKYDMLLKVHSPEVLEAWGLLRAHERFRVIAIGTPVPPFPGKPLDPPFRSRFQSRYIDVPILTPTTYFMEKSFPDAKKLSPFIKSMANVIATVRASTQMENSSLTDANLLPAFDQTAFEHLKIFDHLFPNENQFCPKGLIERFWPSSWVKKPLSKPQIELFDNLLRKFNIAPLGEHADTRRSFIPHTSYKFCGIDLEKGSAILSFKDSKNGVVKHHSNRGYSDSKPDSKHISTDRCDDILSRMLQAHACGQDILLVGPKSSSKSHLINEFGKILNYNVSTIHIYRDMTARDLLQRRNTRSDGSTFWEDTGLIQAARHGDIAVLEGVQWIDQAVLAGISRLFHDREICLPDNTRLVSQFVYKRMKLESGLSDDELSNRGVFCIHPSFRIIATATTSNSKIPVKWFGEEISGLFHFVRVNSMSPDEERILLTNLSNASSEIVDKVLEFSTAFQQLANSRGHENVLAKSINLSTRTLLRICKRAKNVEDLHRVIYNALLGSFLPHLVREELKVLLKEVGIKPNSQSVCKIEHSEIDVKFGEVSVQKYVIQEGDEEALTLIPHTTDSRGHSAKETVFFDNTGHSLAMRDMALDFVNGEHLLLIGNQGVGKNKLTDRFLELLKRPREYIQLHRDTTVQSLLVQPVVENGRISYKDSPLVKAAKYGRVLVVDEADKAPIYITSIFKSLAENGEMEVASGCKIKKHGAKGNDIPLHKDFRMIVLANRPGFPFLGNDFYGAIGDVFGTFAIENLDFESEVKLLCELAPTINQDILKRLVGAFGDLRRAFDDGLVNYPYSLRELINIVRHMELYPDEPLENVLRNVFDFDLHQHDMLRILTTAFGKHGIKLTNLDILSLCNYNSDLEISYSEKAPANVGSPKHGKIDENNEPHVGGNTWHGGTGGSDTAGMGGRGGPYRVNSGHKIHQLTDQQKAQVSPEVIAAARAMGKESLKKRLEEINMSNEFAALYTEFSKTIEPQVQQLRIILEGVQGKEKEKIWLRNQIDGEIDDGKLVEGLTGEHSIFKKRGQEDSQLNFHELPKRIKFVFDVSGSMFRFNTYDYRLNKSLETALMLMKALKSMGNKYRYDIVGHSGDSACIPFVEVGKPPKNEKEMMRILDQMLAHSQYCWTGDNTLEATRVAIRDIVQEKADDYLVIVISDANLQRYGIDPRVLGGILERDPKVNAIVMFIGSLGGEANEVSRQLPKGKSFVVNQTSHIPQFIQEIFSSIIEQ